MLVTVQLPQLAVLDFEDLSACFFISLLLKQQNESNAEVWHRLRGNTVRSCAQIMLSKFLAFYFKEVDIGLPRKKINFHIYDILNPWF